MRTCRREGGRGDNGVEVDIEVRRGEEGFGEDVLNALRGSTMVLSWTGIRKAVHQENIEDWNHVQPGMSEARAKV